MEIIIIFFSVSIIHVFEGMDVEFQKNITENKVIEIIAFIE